MRSSNRAVEDWSKLLHDVAAVSAMLDRLLHHGHAQMRPMQLAHQDPSGLGWKIQSLTSDTLSVR